MACGPVSRRYFVETWGCQMNVLDGERMAGQLEELGLRAGARSAEADVVILNTCSVREKAESKVYSALGVLGRRKRERPELVIGVTGCVAQVAGRRDPRARALGGFRARHGPGRERRAGGVARAVRNGGRFASLELPADSPVYQFRQISRGSAFQAYVTVIEGCDQFCTFCIVPFTRGRERSRRATEILEEVAHLGRRGYTEVTLLGQTVNAYRDPEDGLGPGRAAAARVAGSRGSGACAF